MTKSVILLLYLSFVSLGIPAALLGAGWPAMQADTGIPFGYLALIQMLFAGLPILSSYLSGMFMRRFGIARDMILGMALTAASLFLFSFAPSFAMIAGAAILLGFGYGVLNTGLNTFAAENYGPHHVNWLHSFWGIGAMGGPLLLSLLLSGGFSWRAGYQAAGLIQGALIMALLVSLPLWEREEQASTGEDQAGDRDVSVRDYLRMEGAAAALLMFFLYGGVEACFGLWGASYLFLVRSMSAADAASWISIFFLSVTAGRMLTGFISFRLSHRAIITGGVVIVSTGLILMMLPLPLHFTLTGILLIGLGSAPVFPTMVHDVPSRFGRRHTGAIMGLQMTFAALGNMGLPFLFGFIAGVSTSERIYLLPYYILVHLLLFFLAFRAMYRKSGH